MALASLRLTVALFAMAIFLIFAGTMAQVDKDIWEVMDQYFRTWLAWIPLADVLSSLVLHRRAPAGAGNGFRFPAAG